MLTVEENELMTRVGPGTPMGEVLRRYWVPATLSTELPDPDCPPIRVRILGEDLVAFRDTNGDVGLLDNFCPHRRASLFFGRNEEYGLRCVYHGWKFDINGDCVDMPSEPAESNFKDKVKIKAYPAYEAGGVVWAYMGPAALMPPRMTFEVLGLPDDQVMVNRNYSLCNFVQAMEGSIDSSHIGFLHRNLNELDMSDFDDGTDKLGFPSTKMSTKIRGAFRNPHLSVQKTDYGIRYAGIRTTPNGHQHLRITANIFPFFNMTSRLPDQGVGLSCFMPVDDETHYRYNISGKLDRPFTPEERERRGASPRGVDENGQPLRGKWNDFLIDRKMQKEVSYTGITGVNTQDQAVTESMEPITDRWNEHLGTTDAAIIHVRRALVNAARQYQEGDEPPPIPPDIMHNIRAHEEIVPADADWRLYGAFAGEDRGVPVK